MSKYEKEWVRCEAHVGLHQETHDCVWPMYAGYPGQDPWGPLPEWAKAYQT